MLGCSRVLPRTDVQAFHVRVTSEPNSPGSTANNYADGFTQFLADEHGCDRESSTLDQLDTVPFYKNEPGRSALSKVECIYAAATL